MSKRVLVVDDSPSIREMVGLTLEENGFAIVKSEDGAQALNFCQQDSAFDLVITDINMPNKDGIQLVKDLRALDAFQYTPILILTTESQTEKKMEAKHAGATGWIVKPFETDKLLATVKKVIR